MGIHMKVLYPVTFALGYFISGSSATAQNIDTTVSFIDGIACDRTVFGGMCDLATGEVELNSGGRNRGRKAKFNTSNHEIRIDRHGDLQAVDVRGNQVRIDMQREAPEY